MVSLDRMGLEYREFVNLIDNLHDEILIYDNNFRLLYVNKACERHYGFTQDEMLGLSFWDMVKKYRGWDNSVLPVIYEHKRPVKQKQKTYLGYDVLTIGVPILDEQGEVEYALLNIRDDCNENEVCWRDGLVAEQEDTLDERPDNLIYHSSAMARVVEAARKVATINAPCLLLGESGCGKSLLAKFIHTKGNRADKPLVVVNCAAIPHELFESELFGHVKGAFSGATHARGGLLAKAEGGTLFLDEISELPPAMQAKLLHVVQEMEYRPVGSSQTVSANVRILAASNKNLERMVQSRAFRQDLYFRLNVFDITIPPLRDRDKDILPLLYHFLHYFGIKYRRTKTLTPEAQSFLRQYPWPGNVRELAHLVERMVATTESEVLTIDHLPTSVYQTSLQPLPGHGYSLDDALGGMEREMIRKAQKVYGSTRSVAKALGISQSRASRLIRKHCPPHES
ncbi:sigma 54-interacting transcriptional regulator [Desulfovibrio sp. Huiquan2017]|uniref:sigma-54 interaction domain-containing protein n=1 Tax=Desulfovibrio sp. Huiquan2017 TaxID=2816861 RepID=UPI001A915D6F|nr:sigma 54-interacting transcriptional regulator [Desulfovibrio sp. Huiquan2017]